MIPNSDLVFYACVARDTTILAEFNSKDADLGALAVSCLEKAPSFHYIFSHTVRGNTYMFLFDDPFLYFAIFGDKLKNWDGLLFLKSVRDAFSTVVETDSVKYRLETLNSHCFQGEFNPVFHKLLASPPSDLDGPGSPGLVLRNRSGGLGSPREKKLGSIPLLWDTSKCLKQKRRLLFGGASPESKGEKEVDISDDGIVLGRDLSVGMQKNGGLFTIDSGHQRARKVWKKHVWVVLSLDLILCTILFAVWLWICRGFKCIDG